MSKNRQLASRIGIYAAAVSIVAASAFADSRPSNETWRQRGGRATERRDGVDRHTESQRGNDRRAQSGDRSRTQDRERARTQDGRRSEDRERYEQHRNGQREGRDGVYNGRPQTQRSTRGYENRQPYHARGRVSRVDRYGNGYRVWVGGAPYPFYVPMAHYRRDRFRVGVIIDLGGYYNPGGYYDYYDDGGYSRGDLRGVVESVDYRSDTFVVRNEASGSFVTVAARDRRGEVRPGDYVELYGDWSRGGVFRAYDVDVVDRDYRR